LPEESAFRWLFARSSGGFRVLCVPVVSTGKAAIGFVSSEVVAR
jgi:hypothetical protein